MEFTKNLMKLTANTWNPQRWPLFNEMAVMEEGLMFMINATNINVKIKGEIYFAGIFLKATKEVGPCTSYH